MRKNLHLLIPFILCLFIVPWATIKLTRAQAPPSPFTVQSTISHTSCALPPAGTSAYCFASDGIWQSINGAAYTQVAAGSAGVTSITVNGGSAQSGAVVLTIPTKATTTVTSTASTTIQ